VTAVDDLIANARGQLGEPYVFGDEGPDSFDCSGLMQYCLGLVGIRAPRTAAEQQKWASPISASSRKPGDLIFWGSPATHVALYVGNGQMISAPGTGQRVHLVSVPSDATGYGRVPGLGTAVAGAVDVVGNTVGLVGDVLGGAKHIALTGLFVVLGLGLVVAGVVQMVSNGKTPLDLVEKVVS
jgi:hypothetical protein